MATSQHGHQPPQIHIDDHDVGLVAEVVIVAGERFTEERSDELANEVARSSKNRR